MEDKSMFVLSRLFSMLGIVGAIVGCGLFAGMAGAIDTWSPRQYVAKPGDCFVPPQGDPLYDSHYAQEVNVPNCQAFKDQATAHQIDADTRAENFKVLQARIATVFILLVGLGVIAFFIYAAVRGGSHE
jgi:hypothetical protein